MSRRLLRRLLLLLLLGVLLRLVLVVLLMLLLRPVVTLPVRLFLLSSLFPYRWCVIPRFVVIFVRKTIEALKAKLLLDTIAN
jgi:hypothetical protein